MIHILTCASNKVSAVQGDPSIAIDADPSHVFLNPAIFRMLLPSTVPKDVAAQGNKAEVGQN